MAPKFIKTSVRKNENLGERLSKKRAALGYGIKDVERAIRIRAKHIEYIENSQWEKLPPDVYVRGFLKSYASFLNLNTDKVLTLYLKEKGLNEHIDRAGKKEEKPKRKTRRSRFVLTPKKITITSLILVGAAILGYVGWQVSLLAAPPKLEVISPTDNSKVFEEEIVVEGSTDIGADVFINEVPIGVSPEGEFKEKISLEEGKNLIRIKALNRLERAREITLTVVAEIPEIAENKQAPEELLVMKIEIGPEPSGLSIMADGKNVTLEKDKLLPGSTQTVRAKETITVEASNSGSVRIFLNDKDLGRLGDSDETVEKIFTRKDL